MDKTFFDSGVDFAETFKQAMLAEAHKLRNAGVSEDNIEEWASGAHAVLDGLSNWVLSQMEDAEGSK